jgi:hypothetical protein
VVNADDYTLFMLGDSEQTGSFPTVPEPGEILVLGGAGIFFGISRKRKPTA